MTFCRMPLLLSVAIMAFMFRVEVAMFLASSKTWLFLELHKLHCRC
jgi:hypothetical protein